MTEQRYRSLGAIIGLATGVGLMIALGYGGVIPGSNLWCRWLRRRRNCG